MYSYLVVAALTKRSDDKKGNSNNKIVFCIQHAAVIMVSNTWCEEKQTA